MVKSPPRSRVIAAIATLALVAGGLVGGGAGPAVAHPEACATGAEQGGRGLEGQQAGQDEEEICLSPEQVAAMDDAGAELGVDEIARSKNLRFLTNVPKPTDFAAVNRLNTDLAFTGHYAVAGNYQGFTIFDLANPRRPKLISTTVCAGSQNDVSVSGNLLFTSTDSARNHPECEGSEAASALEKESWEGIRIFDISDKTQPRYVGAVETDCGSHTHTAIPDPAGNRTIIYVSSYGPADLMPDCLPPHDKISIVEVPHDAPEQAAVVAEPVLFADGGFPGIPSQTTATTGCHDITAYPARGLAAGACLGQGVLLDISDLTDPKVIDTVTDPNFAFWHSATFNNDATTVVFTDELGGGTVPTCNPTVGPNRGADAIYRIIDTDAGKRLEFASYFKIPRVNANTENCVAHNGSLVPVPGRDIMVQAWYQGGVSVWEFTDPAKPRELAFFERGPLSADSLIPAGSWSAYWYNGLIYSSDLQKGLDVLFLSDPAFVVAGLLNRTSQFNAQTQTPHRFG